MNEIIKGFKGFKKDLTCQGFQFKEGETFETDKAIICQKGFHFCLSPLDVLDYYDLVDDVFHEVESLGDTDKKVDGDSKMATTKIKIGRKLTLKDFIDSSINHLKEGCKIKSSDYSQLAASGDSSKLAASGDYSQLAASGDYSQLAASGDSSKLAASGHSSQLAASGDSSQLAASGHSSKLAASGDYSKLAASGHYSKLAASGHSSKLAASGHSSQLAASGDSSQLAASGHSSQLAASGHSSKLAASGDYSKLAASGDSSKLEISGNDSVGAAIGIDSKIKGVKGSWITLAEWACDSDKNRYIPLCVKSVKIDGKKIKANTWYCLKDGEFLEVK